MEWLFAFSLPLGVLGLATRARRPLEQELASYGTAG